MTQARQCDACSQAHNCKQVYGQLGNQNGPSVVMRVLVAFALPIGVFAAGLGLFDRLLDQVVAHQYRTVCAFALAFGVTAILMLGVSVMTKRFDKKRC